MYGGKEKSEGKKIELKWVNTSRHYISTWGWLSVWKIEEVMSRKLRRVSRCSNNRRERGGGEREAHQQQHNMHEGGIGIGIGINKKSQWGAERKDRD